VLTQRAPTRDLVPTGFAVGQAATEDGRVPADEARDAALEVIADDVRRPAQPLTRRAYRCDACGYETLTVGYPLPQDSRCCVLIHDPGRNGSRQSSHQCRGRLEGRFA
jgi:hypothetical protein